MFILMGGNSDPECCFSARELSPTPLRRIHLEIPFGFMLLGDAPFVSLFRRSHPSHALLTVTLHSKKTKPTSRHHIYVHVCPPTLSERSSSNQNYSTSATPPPKKKISVHLTEPTLITGGSESNGKTIKAKRVHAVPIQQY